VVVKLSCIAGDAILAKLDSDFQDNTYGDTVSNLEELQS
jgi:hypothetical protein